MPKTETVTLLLIYRDGETVNGRLLEETQCTAAFSIVAFSEDPSFLTHILQLLRQTPDCFLFTELPPADNNPDTDVVCAFVPGRLTATNTEIVETPSVVLAELDRNAAFCNQLYTVLFPKARAARDGQGHTAGEPNYIGTVSTELNG
jgi:hypothetical protein